MAPRHDSPRPRPSASLVIALVALFIALGGGAYAASKIGTKQLKNKAVTTKKLDNKAVTGKKLASKAVSAKKLDANAVKTNKLAPGAVTGSKIDEASTPFGQVVHTATGKGEQVLGPALEEFPLDGATYTQKAGMTNEFFGAVDVEFDAGCTQPRVVAAYLLIDAANPLVPAAKDVAAFGQFQDTGTGTTEARVEMGAYQATGGVLYGPEADTSHELSLILQRICSAGDASLVIALVALFIALGSGAYAASKIGTKQLKSKAVTTKKLDNKAVSGKKLASKSVSAKKLKPKAVKTNKLAPDAVTGSKIDAESTPFTRVVHTASASAEQDLGAAFGVYPLDGDTYTQKADEVNKFAATLDVTFAASCNQPRTVTVALLVDPVDPLTPVQREIALYSSYTDTGTGAHSARISLGPLGGGRSLLFQPQADKERKLDLVAVAGCNSGSGIKATFGAAQVIAAKVG
jgi:hypothetical protein